MWRLMHCGQRGNNVPTRRILRFSIRNTSENTIHIQQEIFSLQSTCCNSVPHIANPTISYREHLKHMLLGGILNFPYRITLDLEN